MHIEKLKYRPVRIMLQSPHEFDTLQEILYFTEKNLELSHSKRGAIMAFISELSEGINLE